jgi:endoglucanase
LASLILDKGSHARLRTLLNLYTAPFREQQVAAHCQAELTRRGVPHCTDAWGNIIVGAASVAEYRKLISSRTSEPLWLMIAHMDHPGFHVVRRLSDTRLLAKWHGGGPRKHLRGTTVWIGDQDGRLFGGKISRAILTARGDVDKLEITMPAAAKPLLREQKVSTLFGSFEFESHLKRAGKRLYCRVADDLVGVHILLESMAKPGKQPPRLLGLLTRGEEVGFVGAVHHFADGHFANARRPAIALSIETSRNRTGARSGRGPVIRLGDRRTVFDATAAEQLTQLANKRLGDKFQRQLMDGGVCEATAATAAGITAAGLAIPLGNYHNQCLDHGPSGEKQDAPAPEYVHLDDVAGAIHLCRGLATNSKEHATLWAPLEKRLQQRAKRYRKLLERYPID